MIYFMKMIPIKSTNNNYKTHVKIASAIFKDLPINILICFCFIICVATTLSTTAQYVRTSKCMCVCVCVFVCVDSHSNATRSSNVRCFANCRLCFDDGKTFSIILKNKCENC